MKCWPILSNGLKNRRQKKIKIARDHKKRFINEPLKSDAYLCCTFEIKLAERGHIGSTTFKQTSTGQDHH